MNANYRTTRLSNGIVLATAEMPYMQSVACGVWCTAGSRHETPALNGIAHLVEHLLFKGTPSRDSFDISREVESLGASLDAFTTEDHTCFSVRGPAETFARLAVVLADLYQHPTIDPAELEREREVVLEEIAMYRDNPAQHVEDLLGLAAWPNHPLGMPITGSEDSVAQISRGDVFAFHQGFYTGSNTFVTVAGAIRHEEAVDTLAPLFADLPAGEPADFLPIPTLMRFNGPRRVEELRGIEQSHLCIGFHSASRHDAMRFPLRLLSVLLGENMSSRLFQVLREEQGLCYSISSDVLALEETGLLSIYAGLDSEEVPRALELVERCLRDFTEQTVTPEALRDAQTYAIGQSRLALESVAQQMLWCGECLLAHQRIVEPAETVAALEAVRPEEVREAAQAVFHQDHAALAYIGSEIPEFALDGFLA